MGNVRDIIDAGSGPEDELYLFSDPRGRDIKEVIVELKTIWGKDLTDQQVIDRVLDIMCAGVQKLDLTISDDSNDIIIEPKINHEEGCKITAYDIFDKAIAFDYLDATPDELGFTGEQLDLYSKILIAAPQYAYVTPKIVFKQCKVCGAMVTQNVISIVIDWYEEDIGRWYLI